MSLPFLHSGLLGASAWRMLSSHFCWTSPERCPRPRIQPSTSQRHQTFVLPAHEQPSSRSSLHVVQAVPAGQKTTTYTEQTENLAFS